MWCCKKAYAAPDLQPTVYYQTYFPTKRTGYTFWFGILVNMTIILHIVFGKMTLSEMANNRLPDYF